MEKKKFNVFIPVCIILAVILAGAVAFGVYMYFEKVNSDQKAEEYKLSYESLLADIENSKIKGEEYQTAYNALISAMLNDAASAESLGNQIIDVWHNAIWSISDKDTDKFTKKNGKFVNDFNDALSALFKDEDFKNNCSTLISNQNQIKEYMKNMLNPPEGFEKAFDALESMYNSYISFTNKVINCDGSYESFSNDFMSADEDFIQKYHSAELYIK